MVTSRPVPQQTAQIFSPLAGQKRAGLRFSQTGQNTNSPRQIRAIQQNTPRDDKRQKSMRSGRAYSHRIPLAELKCVSPKRRLEMAPPPGGGPGGPRREETPRRAYFRPSFRSVAG